MSTKVSGGAAYQQLKPIEGMGQTLQFWGQMAAQRGREDRSREEREEVRKAKELADWSEKYNLKPEDFQSKYTGFGSYDDVNRDYAQYSMNNYVNLNRQAREAMERGDLKEKNRLEGEMLKRKNNFNLIKQGQEHFATVYEDYKKAVNDGTISGSSKYYEDIMQAAIVDHNVAVREDEHGNPVYVGRTADGDPFEVSHKDLMDGSFSYNLKQDIDGKSGLVNNVLNTLGTMSNTTTKGLMKITSEQWSEDVHGKATEEAINATIADDRVMADLLYQFTGGQTTKMSNFTDEDYNKVRSIFKDRVRAGYDEKYKEEFDSSRARLGLDRAKFKAKQGEDNEVIEFEPVTTAGGELIGGNSLFSASDLPYNEEGGEFTLRTKGGKPIKGIIETDPKAELLTIKESGGKYFARIRTSQPVEDNLGNVEDVFISKVVELSDAELNRLARGSNLGTAKDLKDNLDNRKAAFQQRSGGNSNNNNDPLGIF